MPKKAKNGSKGNGEPYSADELWIAQRHSLKGPAGERAWENRLGGPPNSGKFLELADIALGLKKPESKNRRSAGGPGVHVSAHKTEPYSR